MSTQRRTLKTPPAKAARKLFKTVPQYLAWIRNATESFQDRERDVQSTMRNLIRQLASRILIRARAEDVYFRQLFQMPDGFPKRVAIKKMLVLNKTGEYTLKLPLVHNGPLRTFKMLVGPSHGVNNGESLLKLHESLTKEQKTVQRHVLRTILDEEDFISPNRIAAWLSRLFKKVIKGIDRTETKSFHVAAQTLFTKRGMAAFMTLSPKEDNDANVMTILLRFEVTVCMGELPWNFRLRQLYPRDMPQTDKSGRQINRDVKEGFNSSKLSIYLRCPIHKPSYLPDISNLPTRAKTYLEYSLKRCGTAFTSKSLPESFSQLNLGDDHGDPRIWRIDYVEIERLLLNRISGEPRYRAITHAFDLYDNIATYGNKIVPRLNQKTKRSLSLWLFKRGGFSLETIYGAFQEVLKLVNDCIMNEFSPSFCQAQENTLDEDLDSYNEILNTHIDLPKDKSDYEVEYSESEEEDSEDGEPRLNNIEELLRIIQADNVEDAVRLINIY